MTDLQNTTVAHAAARAGFSERTARRLRLPPPHPPSKRKIAHGRTVSDASRTLGRTTYLPLLEMGQARAVAVTLLRHLQSAHPLAIPDDRDFGAPGAAVCGSGGSERSRARHHLPPDRGAGDTWASPDFTHCDELGVRSQASRSRTCFTLRHGLQRWEHVASFLVGTSFTALAENLPASPYGRLVGCAGAKPPEPKPFGRLSALTTDQRERHHKRYDAFVAITAWTPAANNRGEAHEKRAVAIQKPAFSRKPLSGTDPARQPRLAYDLKITGTSSHAGARRNQAAGLVAAVQAGTDAV